MGALREEVPEPEGVYLLSSSTKIMACSHRAHFSSAFSYRCSL